MTEQDTGLPTETEAHALTLEKKDKVTSSTEIEITNSDLTPEDVLNMLPIPPVGTICKIRLGKYYVHNDLIDKSNNETSPFILEILKDKTKGDDEPLALIGLRNFNEKFVRTAALKLIAHILKADYGYSMIHPADSIVFQHANLIGYYATSKAGVKS
jgi:hypothetical protein